MTKQDEIDNLNNQIARQREMLKNQEDSIRKYHHEVDKLNARIDTLLYNLVINQNLIKSREKTILDYEHQYGKLALVT